MKNSLIIFLFTTILMAQDNNLSNENKNILTDVDTTNIVEVVAIVPNPKIYAVLGNDIYDNVGHIEKLKELKKFSGKIFTIDSYVSEVSKTKEIGYKIENSTSKITKGQYLNLLRKLSKRNEKFKKELMSLYKASIKHKDSKFFLEAVNSGLVDTLINKDEIMNYYMQDSSNIDATGIIQTYLDEAQAKEKKIKASKIPRVTKKQIQNAKIKRLRKKDKDKEEQLNRELDEKLMKKKNNILKEQMQNLSKN